MKRLIENVNNVFNKAADHAENERSKRQITISIVTLVMAIVLMGSASWAWFTITTSVDVQDISVAMTEFKNLEIARAYSETSGPEEVSSSDAETGDSTWGGVVNMSDDSRLRLEGLATYARGLVTTVKYDDTGRTSGLVTLSKSEMQGGITKYTHQHSNLGLNSKVYAAGFGVWLRTNEEDIGNILMTVGDVKAGDDDLNLPIGVAVRIDRSKTCIPATYNSETGRYSAVLFKDAPTYKLSPNEAHLVEIIVYFDGQKIYARDVNRPTKVTIGYIQFNKAENWASETSVTISGTSDAPAVDNAFLVKDEIDGSLDLRLEANPNIDLNKYMYSVTFPEKNIKMTTSKIKPSAADAGRIDLLGSLSHVYYTDSPIVKATGGISANTGSMNIAQSITVTSNEITDSGVGGLSIAPGKSTTTNMCSISAESRSYDSTPTVKYDFVDPLDKNMLGYTVSGLHPGRYDLYFYNASNTSQFIRVCGTADEEGSDSLTLNFEYYKDIVSTTNFKCRVVSYDVEVDSFNTAHVSIYKTGLFNAEKGISDESSGTCGYGVTWKYESGTLTISGSGKMYDYSYSNYAPWWPKYGNNISSIVIESGVTYISGFQGLDKLESVRIESGGIEIGQRCFANCGSFSLRYKCGDTIDMYAFYESTPHITCTNHIGDETTKTAEMKDGSTRIINPYHTHGCRNYMADGCNETMPLNCGVCGTQNENLKDVKRLLD